MKRIITAVALLAACTVSLAQAAAWNENALAWTPPAACADGSAIAGCATTGYVIERAPSQTGTFATLATVGASVTTYTHAGAVAGDNCYRVSTKSATATSAPSSVACKRNTQPLPAPPTDVRIVVALTSGANVTPAYRVLADGSRSSPYYALVPVGTECSGAPVFTYRSKVYRRVSVGREHLVGTTDPRNLAAPCS